MNFEKELTEVLNRHREDEIQHIEVKDENNFYSLIASGNLEVIEPMASGVKDIHMYEGKGYGRLSADPVRNMRYHFVTSVAMITRYCVEKGLDRETAYTMSDLYINRMDRMDSLEDIVYLHSEMYLEFTRKMAALPKQKVYSLCVIKAMNHVNNNLNKKLDVGLVAEALGVNRSYLSRIFSKECEKPLGTFITEQKLKAAANMLRYSEYPYSAISEFLGFSSQSHFTACFRKQYGLTPAAYRKDMENRAPGHE